MEEKISDIPYDEIIIDFSSVKSMSPNFANTYLEIKKGSNKLIHEVNVPLHLEKTLSNTYG